MFSGSMVALVTPMKEDMTIDFERLSKLIEWHISSGTDAIVSCGTTGESATLSHAEQAQLITHTVEVVNSRVPVIAGTYAVSTSVTIELTQHAMDAGADGALIMTPAYIKPTQAGLIKHYKAITTAVGLPIIVYNVPSRTCCDLLPETLKALADIPNIIGIKEATGDMNRVMDIQALCGNKIDIYSGDDATALHLLRLGGKGVISVAANAVPKVFSEMVKAALSDDLEKAQLLDDQLKPLYQALSRETNPIPVKWAVHHLGHIGETIRPPLTILNPAFHNEIANALSVVVG